MTTPRMKRSKLDSTLANPFPGTFRLDVLETPGSLHSGHAAPYYADAYHNPAHPHMWAQPGHNEVRGEVKGHVGDIEES